MPASKKRAPRRKRTQNVKLALIGAGAWATSRHFPVLAEMRDVVLAAVCDLDEPRAQRVADAFNIPRVYTDYRHMLDEIRPDAAYAIMRPHHIFDVAVGVLQQKCNLFIEKPPGVTAYQTRQLACHARENGVLTMVGFQRRHVPLVNKLKKKVEVRGPIHTVEVNYIKHQPDPLDYYQGAIDILMCDGIHAVDTLRYLAGASDGAEVIKVSSSVRAIDAEFPNAFHALVTFSNGVTGILKVNWAAGHRVFATAMHTTGATAYAEPDVEGWLHTDGDTTGERYTPEQCAKSDNSLHCLGFHALNRHFIDCIKKNRQPISSLADAAESMALAERICACAFEGPS
jgi:virulence factor